MARCFAATRRGARSRHFFSTEFCVLLRKDKALEKSAVLIGNHDLGLDSVPFNHRLDFARDGALMGPVDDLIQRLVHCKKGGDAGAESLGHPVKMFEGSYENLKVTTANDLLIAEMFLKAASR